MDTLIAVLRGSNAIAVPEPATSTPTHEGYHSAATAAYMRQLREDLERNRRGHKHGLLKGD